MTPPAASGCISCRGRRSLAGCERSSFRYFRSRSTTRLSGRKVEAFQVEAAHKRQIQQRFWAKVERARGGDVDLREWSDLARLTGPSRRDVKRGAEPSPGGRLRTRNAIIAGGELRVLSELVPHVLRALAAVVPAQGRSRAELPLLAPATPPGRSRLSDQIYSRSSLKPCRRRENAVDEPMDIGGDSARCQ